ncbi:MAG: YcgN family cysteine cluster protein [Gammaproteobacteria bacterium]|uniref:YcgN family cysteine cluster protein n=1 Tax=Marinomonas TaxID=28253 RepID=UPI000C28886F|nr:YcgN family cysteine cluster protein [Marinomonas sp. ef1]MBU1294743.1 YcgN family cysteine cluster protein [Gammaproteobacteria bacterium]MBU1468435.1 YcgN family cysteine cluster protein [Gammaproteobacteria bacterium]MBU2021252.1 YcgN family cysteine cluster protein [Gammaproteobacteria bacterium]MBU2238341.1 YcgN family cysteine cluster protein [Gammaproteobacteria bacterium]MBU2316926.1 YcgN family cysteine cluster protein [Gammaproteobacteria bacterium]|tara:strand:- start:6982 stop:7461 length:480 start_codon:yes stop_codon:yes gene_type:complete
MIAKRYEPFWKTTPLEKMSPVEWESICDGCGKCCLQKLQDDETEEVFYTNLSCHQLNIGSCQCKVYETRQDKVSTCITLTPDQVDEFHWLPDTCSYRVLYETKDLPNWHPLVVGSDKEMLRQGLTVRHYAVNENTVDEEEWETHVIKWVHGMPEPYDVI